MKRLRTIAAWVLVLGALFVPVFPDPPLHSGAYVQNVTPTSAIVARIEAVPTALGLRVSAKGETVWRAAPDTPRRRHAFAVDGLRPGTRHDYVIVDAGGTPIDGGSFATAPASDAAPFRFAVVGDSGGLPWWVWLQNNPLGYAVARYDLLPVRDTVRRVGTRMAAVKPAFWLHVGDVVYPWGRHDHYGPGFFRPFAELLRSAPCYPVLGNHDVLEDSGRQFLANFYLPTNEVTGDERFYAFSWGPIDVVALDLNRPVAPDGPELRFFEAAMAASTAPWRIAFAHFPIYSASRQRDRGDLVQHLLPALRRHDVALLFVGHDHNYQRFGDPVAEPTDVVMIVSGGGGKSLYELRDHPRLTAAHKSYQFCTIDVAGRALTVRAIGADGAELDTCLLDLGPRAPATPDPDNPRHRRIGALLR